jgi:hypothetical protein
MSCFGVGSIQSSLQEHCGQAAIPEDQTEGLGLFKDQLWLPTSSHSSPARRLAGERQEGVQAVHGRGADHA